MQVKKRRPECRTGYVNISNDCDNCVWMNMLCYKHKIKDFWFTRTTIAQLNFPPFWVRSVWIAGREHGTYIRWLFRNMDGNLNEICHLICWRQIEVPNLNSFSKMPLFQCVCALCLVTILYRHLGRDGEHLFVDIGSRCCSSGIPVQSDPPHPTYASRDYGTVLCVQEVVTPSIQ